MLNMNKLITSTVLALSVSVSTYAEDVTLVVKRHGQDKFETIVVDESEVEQVKNSNLYLSVEEEVWLSRPELKIKPLDKVNQLKPKNILKNK